MADRDPIRFVRGRPGLADRELAGLVAALLAYGRVEQLLKSIGRVMDRLDPYPSLAIDSCADLRGLERRLGRLSHRWTTGREIAALLRAARDLQRRHGSLDAWMGRCRRPRDGDIRPALSRWVGGILCRAPGLAGTGLLPDPAGGSACKRLLLFLRWMVRHDGVDPGGWRSLTPAELIIPVDVHVFRAARALRFTRRRRADLCAALDITRALRRFDPADPVKYDFALAHAGMERTRRRGGIDLGCGRTCDRRTLRFHGPPPGAYGRACGGRRDPSAGQRDPEIREDGCGRPAGIHGR